MSERNKIIAAFAAVYVIWGSTYLAIRIGIETFPPGLLAAFRFLVSGVLLVGFALFRGVKLPREPRIYLNTAIVGILLLLGGNGLLVWAQQHVPSGLSAFFVASVSIWMVLIERLWKGGERMSWLGIGGIFCGFAGVLFLLSSEGKNGFQFFGEGGKRLIAECVLLFTAIFWSLGSIYAKHSKMPEDSVLSTGLQMLFGCAALFIAAALHGEFENFTFSQVSTNSLIGLIYLVLFGSCIGFTCYAYMLKHAPAAKVGTYAYVNPLVAAFLGWTVLGERFSTFDWIGMSIIVCGVVLVLQDRIRANPKHEG